MGKNSIEYIIVTHRLFNGAGQDLYEFLKTKGTSALLIEHSFISMPDRRTVYSYFDGKKEEKKYSFNYKPFFGRITFNHKVLTDFLCYMKDFMYSLCAAVRYPTKYKVYVGCGGFNVLAGLLLKLFGRVDKVVFYTIDFSLGRFNNNYLDKLYMLIDKISVKYSDRTWNLCDRIVEGREKIYTINQKWFSKQRTVPIGIWPESLSNKRHDIIKNKIMVFCGHIEWLQGIQLILEAMPEIIRRISTCKLLIIGDGGCTHQFIKMSQKYNIAENVEFKGAIYSQNMLNTLLSSARVGLAPYSDDNISVYYSDVTKPKQYLANGLPVIITKRVWISREIEKRKMGISINYNKQELIEAIIKVMTDDQFYVECKNNANDYVSDLDWNKIFSNVINDLNTN